MQDEKIKIGIVGQGYVGMPLALEFGKVYNTIGYDINKRRIEELKRGLDSTKEFSVDEISAPKKLQFSSSIDELKSCNIYIVTVPTPIDEYKKPDLKPLKTASITLGGILKKGDIVIYESTVFPGCTEEICVPLLEKYSKLKFNLDFFCGYSPERIVPGDKINTLSTIQKITSGSNPEIALKINNLYKSIITAGTYLAPNIKVAEAAKVIENAQRDVNISFINELAIIFDLMHIDTQDVLDAAGTKWNFLKFKPGLVGGHCISVDPYYLASKSESLGYFPEVILSGRRVNERISSFIASKTIKLLIKSNVQINKCSILILGITFKENCSDIRNTKVVDVYQELVDFGANVDIYDPEANVKEVEMFYNIRLKETLNKKYDAIIAAVAHSKFNNINLEAIKRSEKSVVFDLKCLFPREEVTCRL